LAVGMLRTAYGPFDMWAEYIGQNVDTYSTTTNTYTNVKKSGYSIMPSYQITPEWTVLARYDSWDPNKDKANDKVATTIIGVNYALTKGVLLQLNYQQDKPEDSTVATTTQYLGQIAWSFARVFAQ